METVGALRIEGLGDEDVGEVVDITARKVNCCVRGSCTAQTT